MVLTPLTGTQPFVDFVNVGAREQRTCISFPFWFFRFVRRRRVPVRQASTSLDTTWGRMIFKGSEDSRASGENLHPGFPVMPVPLPCGGVVECPGRHERTHVNTLMRDAICNLPRSGLRNPSPLAEVSRRTGVFIPQAGKRVEPGATLSRWRDRRVSTAGKENRVQNPAIVSLKGYTPRLIETNSLTLHRDHSRKDNDGRSLD